MRPSRRQLGSPLEPAPAQQGRRRDYRPERFRLEGAWAAAKVKNGARRENHARGSLAYRASPDCDEGIALLDVTAVLKFSVLRCCRLRHLSSDLKIVAGVRRRYGKGYRHSETTPMRVVRDYSSLSA